MRQTLPGLLGQSWSARSRRAAAGFWLGVFFFIVQRAPWFARVGKRPLVLLAIRFSRAIRSATTANGRRILSPHADAAELPRFTRAVVGNFYDFVCDIGQSLRLTRQQLAQRIEAVQGHETYLAARKSGRGAIILTAHLGSFEVGAAALLEFEKTLHVVFKRDTGRFEQTRQTLRHNLGVVEQPVDDGWNVWMRLRDALQANEVVAIQGDRVMPGQKGQRMAFLGGHVLMPTGPVKLAKASGAPIIPVFSVRTPAGRIKLFIEDPIIVGEDSDLSMTQIATVIAKYIAAYPEQWLALHPAFCEDTGEQVEIGA
jgi:lauroyl/myristoyl acyltransferase